MSVIAVRRLPGVTSRPKAPAPVRTAGRTMPGEGVRTTVGGVVPTAFRTAGRATARGAVRTRARGVTRTVLGEAVRTTARGAVRTRVEATVEGTDPARPSVTSGTAPVDPPSGVSATSTHAVSLRPADPSPQSLTGRVPWGMTPRRFTSRWRSRSWCRRSTRVRRYRRRSPRSGCRGCR